MVDMTITFEEDVTEQEDLYRQVCLRLREAAETRLRGVIRYWSVASGENAASMTFTGELETSVVSRHR